MLRQDALRGVMTPSTRSRSSLPASSLRNDPSYRGVSEIPLEAPTSLSLDPRGKHPGLVALSSGAYDEVVGHHDDGGGCPVLGGALARDPGLHWGRSWDSHCRVGKAQNLRIKILKFVHMKYERTMEQ